MMSFRVLALGASRLLASRAGTGRLSVRTLYTLDGQERAGFVKSTSTNDKGKGGWKKNGVGVDNGESKGTALMTDLASANSSVDVLAKLDTVRAAAKPLTMMEASMSAHRLGKYGCSPEGPVVDWFFGELHGLVGVMGGRQVANTAWGLAKMRVPPSHLMWEKVVRRSLKLKSKDFEAQTISNLMWALATAGVSPDAALVQAMSAEAVRKARVFKPQNIVNLMWAFAKLDVVPDAELVEVMSSEAVSKCNDFLPQHIVNLLWSFATLGVPLDAALAEAMSAEAVSKSSDFIPVAISNMMWAFATSDVSPDAALVRAMSSEAVSKCADFTPLDMSNLMWAFATLGVQPDAALVRAMTSEAVSKSWDFKPEEIANVMWAFAKLGVSPDTALVQAMLSEAALKGDDFEKRDVAKLMGALKTLGVSPDTALLQAMPLSRGAAYGSQIGR
jgi:hypothetical protein